MTVRFNQPPRDRQILMAALLYAPALLIGGGAPIFVWGEALGEDWAFGLSVLVTLLIAGIGFWHYRRMMVPITVEAGDAGLVMMDERGGTVERIAWESVDYLLLESTNGFVLTIYGTQRDYVIRQFPTLGKDPEGFAELAETIEARAAGNRRQRGAG